jgi:hypothetical protein
MIGRGTEDEDEKDWRIEELEIINTQMLKS